MGFYVGLVAWMEEVRSRWRAMPTLGAKCAPKMGHPGLGGHLDLWRPKMGCRASSWLFAR